MKEKINEFLYCRLLRKNRGLIYILLGFNLLVNYFCYKLGFMDSIIIGLVQTFFGSLLFPLFDWTFKSPCYQETVKELEGETK